MSTLVAQKATCERTQRWPTTSAEYSQHQPTACANKATPRTLHQGPGTRYRALDRLAGLGFLIHKNKSHQCPLRRVMRAKCGHTHTAPSPAPTISAAGDVSAIRGTSSGMGKGHPGASQPVGTARYAGPRDPSRSSEASRLQAAQSPLAALAAPQPHGLCRKPIPALEHRDQPRLQSSSGTSPTPPAARV